MSLRWAVVGLMVGGCTSVHLAMRNRCWVRTTDRWPGQVTEEVGPCARPAPKWTNDRLTRLVQECVAQQDYLWENRALEAWQHQEALPPRATDEDVLRSCLSEAARAAVSENEVLRAKLKDATAERDRLRSHDEEITQDLGVAAKKPAGSAVATASAEGKGDGSSRQDAKSEESHSTRQASESAPPMIVQPPASQPVILQSPPAAVPQPIIVQGASAPVYPTAAVQPIVIQSPAPQVEPIVVTPQEAPPRTVIRYVRLPARERIRKRWCPPRKVAPNVTPAQSKDDCANATP